MTRTFAALAAILVAACSGSSVLEPGQGAAVDQEAQFAITERPAGGTCTQQATLLPPEPGQPANVIRRQIDAVCQLLHLGRTIGSFQEVAVITPAGPVVTTTETYTAANGDQLFGTLTGTATFPVNGIVTFAGTLTITGGTGRFAGATGTLERSGTVTIATRTGEFTTSGTISY